MRPNQLPVQRKPIRKGFFQRLSAVTRGRRQRVAAASLPASEPDDGNANIARALVIIFAFHIVAVCLIFFHQKFLGDRAEPAAVAEKTDIAPAATNTTGEQEPAVRYRVARNGDSYASIATAEEVDPRALEAANGGAAIRPGLVLRIPAAKKIAPQQAAAAVTMTTLPAATSAAAPQAAAATGPAVTTSVAAPAHDEGLVPAVESTPPPRAVPVEEESAPKITGKTYVVKSGDSIWTIAKRHKVSRESLMKVNGISDPSKLKAGAKLIIPES